jgi:hypothetical protein
MTSTASVYTNITVCDLKPVAYPLISYRRISATVWEYTYKFVLRNDGNGSFETDAGASPTVAHTWNAPYSGLIGLRVTDSLNKTSTANVYTNITVCDLKPVSYPLISYRRLSATVWEYTYKFVLKNQGNGTATGVSAQLQNWPSQVSVVDGNVTFPDVPGSAQVTSTDTFVIRINRSVPVQNKDLAWTLKFTDPGGTKYVLVNFPLY